MLKGLLTPTGDSTIKYALWFTAGLLLASAANAAEITLVPGTYIKTDVFDRRDGLVLNDNSRPSDDDPAMLVLRQGNRIRTVNTKTQKAFTVDLDRPTEIDGGRPGTPEDLKSPVARTMYGTIDHMSASDFRAEGPNKVTGYLNAYFANKSVFGTLRGRLRIGVSYEFLECKVRADDEALGGRVLVPGHCIREHMGTSFDFVAVNSGLGDRLDAFLGLMMDTTFKIFSPTVADETFYYRKN